MIEDSGCHDYNVSPSNLIKQQKKKQNQDKIDLQTPLPTNVRTFAKNPLDVWLLSFVIGELPTRNASGFWGQLPQIQRNKTLRKYPCMQLFM